MHIMLSGAVVLLVAGLGLCLQPLAALNAATLRDHLRQVPDEVRQQPLSRLAADEREQFLSLRLSALDPVGFHRLDKDLARLDGIVPKGSAEIGIQCSAIELNVATAAHGVV